MTGQPHYSWDSKDAATKSKTRNRQEFNLHKAALTA